MGGNKRLEIQESSLLVIKADMTKERMFKEIPGSQEGMPKKRISRSYGYTFLKCCSDQIE